MMNIQSLSHPETITAVTFVKCPISYGVRGINPGLRGITAGGRDKGRAGTGRTRREGLLGPGLPPLHHEAPATGVVSAALPRVHLARSSFPGSEQKISL